MGVLLLLACAGDTKPAARPAHSFADGGADAGHAGSDAAASRSQTSDCIAKSELPRNCDEVCADQGRSCAEDCNFGTALPARAGFYSSLAGCQQGGGVTFAESAACDAPFDEQGFFPYAAVRCCCAPSDFQTATVAQKAPLCKAACAKDPYPPVSDCSAVAGDCSQTCLDSTRGLDLPCARCLIDGVTFTSSGCSSWECVCGGPSFLNIWSGCDEACGPSRQNERELYAAEPRPEPVGRAPSLRLDAPTIHDVYALLVDDADHVWALGATQSPSGRKLALSLFDADLTLIWRWEDMRALGRVGQMARVGDQVVVTAEFVEQTAPLLIFNEAGFVREQPGSLPLANGMAALGDKLLVKYWLTPGGSASLAVVDTFAGVHYRAEASLFEGFALAPWVYAAQGNDTWTFVATSNRDLLWRRIRLASGTSAASIVWNHQLTTPAEDTSAPAIVGTRGDDDILVWGARQQRRANVSGGFPWLAQLGSDGAVRWQWSNAALVTPGTMKDAVQTPSGGSCALSEESWEYAESERPSTGARCSPDGCEALTVRCLDATGSEQWRYHHRSERSTGYAIAAGKRGQLYVAGNTSRDPRRSTGQRAVLLKFEP